MVYTRVIHKGLAEIASLFVSYDNTQGKYYSKYR